MIYSIDEKKIGTWIDESDLFQKTFEITNSDLSDNKFLINDYSINNIVYIECYSKNSEGAITMLNTGHSSITKQEVTAFPFSINGDTEKPAYLSFDNTDTNITGWVATIRYTKRTI